ncbi:MAG: hypothetical protein K8S14_08685, partial [Actinomycetia bacterium]|nr:hypothetical protein [Actinomycetes bacterium]
MKENLMAKKIYIDFDLLIEQVAEGYTVRVLDSPGGQAKAQFTLPFEDHELKSFFVRIGHPRSIEHHETHFRDQSEIETVKAFGSRLFKAIFKDEVWDCLSKSLHETNRQEEIGLRIRLRLLDA